MDTKTASPSSPQPKRGCSADTPLPWSVAAVLFWPIAISGATLDVWSKWAVFRWLDIQFGEYYVVIDGFLRIIPRENEGAAFSMFSGWRVFLVGVSCVALMVMIVLFFSRQITRKIVLFSLGCMTAGIIGNLYDRAFNGGRVRDFIDVLIPVIDYSWPTFNVADSLLCIGVGLLIIANLRAPKDAG
jgi:signal peptidase II